MPLTGTDTFTVAAGRITYQLAELGGELKPATGHSDRCGRSAHGAKRTKTYVARPQIFLPVLSAARTCYCAAAHSDRLSFRISRGIAPFIRTASWNSRKSKRSPSASSASFRMSKCQLPCFVCGGLTGPYHIALNFTRYFFGRHTGFRDHVFDSVFPAPLFGMHAVSTTSLTARNISACKRPRSPNGSPS